MLHSLKDFLDFSILAKDGEIGKAHDFYFDEGAWQVRYLVVDTGSWILGRRVLLSPATIGALDLNARQIPVSLSRDQVKHSPDIDPGQPISRQQESDLHDYYGWPVYWGSLPGNPGDMVLGKPPGLAVQGVVEEGRALEEPPQQPGPQAELAQLRSARETFGLELQARDGEVGNLDDFLVDETWAIRYMVIETGNWFSRKKVLLAPAWVTVIRQDRSRIEVDLSRETIKNSPDYDPHLIINRDYERSLYDHYGRPRYWE